jgi:hypothetical protein
VRRYGFIIPIALIVLGGNCRAESACFRSVGEAAAQSGQRDEGGFRVVEFRRDAFSQVMWAKVASCVRPEKPPVVVHAKLSGIALPDRPKPTQPSSLIPIVAAGAKVSIVRVEENLRFAMVGTALSSGFAGDRVRVRLEPLLDGAAEKFVVGVVRTDGALEMEL